jgi:hypothetical protein
LDKAGTAGGAGAQITANWQFGGIAPQTVICVVDALPCSGISHSR